MMNSGTTMDEKKDNKPVEKLKPDDKTKKTDPSINNNLLLSQVVGIIIGSPEFQRK